MSIVMLAEGVSTSVTPEVLEDVARRHNISISSPSDQAGYLTVLQSADATAALVDALPDYISPLLAPVPTVGGERQYSFPDKSIDVYNAWSKHTSLRAVETTSDILRGVTCVIKDNISVGGIPYTCGTFPQLADPKNKQYPIPVIDSTVVKRLLEAGAHLAGISTCENYSLTPMSYTSANGPVHNPWLRGYNAGGSSSGSACLLGLRRARQMGVPGLEHLGDLTDVAMGGDQAGSIRLPASYCGIYGLKPTFGLVPYTGIAGLHPMIDHTGPMALNIEDIARMLTVLAGYDGLDPRMTPESPLRENVRPYHADLATFTSSASDPTQLGKGLRIGIISESLTSPGTSSDVAQIVSSAAKKHFTAAGATVEEVSVPMHLLAPAIWTASTRTHMGSLTAAGRVPDLLSHTLPHWSPKWPLDQETFDLLTLANPAVVNIVFGETFLSEKYSSASQGKAYRHVFQLREAYNQALESYDVLITPTTPSVAPPHPDLRPEREGGSGVMDKMTLAVGSTNNTCPFNATGHPAMSVPCGWARAAGEKGVGMSKGPEGWLPVGMQLIGRRWDEMSVLKAAKVFEVGGGGLGEWPGHI